MPRKLKVPAYRLHKSSGLARVIIDGQHVYLGAYGTAESREAYARLIAARFTPAVAGKALPVAVNGFPDLSLNELLLRYVEFAERYYVKDGKPTKELVCMKEAMGPLRALFGDIRTVEFGPLKLKAVQQHMIDAGLSRGVINHRTNRIKRILKWGVSEELLPPAIYESVRTVAGLRFGRSAARETEPVGPVADIWVEAVLPYVTPQIAAMIELQRLTGMRPGEVVKMRPADIDRVGEIWFYEPHEHKNRWRGHRRRIPLGPKSQAVIRPFLERPAEACLFSPQEAESYRNEQRAVLRNPNRKTKIYPCELRAREVRKGQSRSHRSKRPKTQSYTTDSYRRAIKYGIDSANRTRKKASPPAAEIPSWHPNQLRHSFATRVRKDFGVEAAQVGLGHARTDVVEVYAEKNLELAAKVARLTG